eukprot:SAG22_NODE_81_length_21778_cov_38.345173_8_plen_105_part_00
MSNHVSHPLVRIERNCVNFSVYCTISSTQEFGDNLEFEDSQETASYAIATAGGFGETGAQPRGRARRLLAASSISQQMWHGFMPRCSVVCMAPPAPGSDAGSTW